jgi:hypothetical protein
MSTVEIFCCYAREDQKLLNDLKAQLAPMERGRQIHLWADTDIDAGNEWKKEIDAHLNQAQIILLLISPDFMASEYCYSTEMKRAMERHQAGETQVLPIILRPALWKATPFGGLQALPTDAKPVLSAFWHSKDEALLNVAEGIRKAVLNMQRKAQSSATTLPATPSQALLLTDQREGNAKGLGNQVKAISIGIAAIVIVALFGGALLLHNIPQAISGKSIPTTTNTRSLPPTSTSTAPSGPVLDRPGTPFLADPMTAPDSQDSWDNIIEPYVSCSFNSQGYMVKVPANTVGGCSTNASATILTDFTYEIDMTIVSGVEAGNIGPTHGAGLMFRYNGQDGASNYGLSFLQNGQYYMFIYKNQTPEAENLGTGQCNSFRQGPNQTNQIDIEMRGSTMMVFVNNIYLMTAVDSQFPSGQIGVQIGSGNDASEVVYSKLKVWKL